MNKTKQNERLLTEGKLLYELDGELRKIAWFQDRWLSLGWDDRLVILRAIIAKTSEIRLREVGEWLIGHYHGEIWLSAKGQHSLYEIMLSELEALKQGKMPE